MKTALTCCRIFWKKRVSWIRRVPYSDLVTTEYSVKAAKQ